LEGDSTGNATACAVINTSFLSGQSGNPNPTPLPNTFPTHPSSGEPCKSQGTD
jgi:hypothetical protein